MTDVTNRYGIIDCIVKLGGSAITVKGSLETEKIVEIRRAVQFIKSRYDEGRKCIVVNGAGSFGHHDAKKYQVNQGWAHLEEAARRRVIDGFAKTRLSVTKLNHIIIDEFVKAEIPAVAHPPFGSWTTKNGEVISDSRDAIHGILEAGFIPVLHGDCVFDTEQGCRILSGDTIIKTLCAEFRPKTVVFLSDVEGVFDRPPDQSGATLLRDIAVSPNGDFDVHVETSVHEQDVTGGIRLKLQSAVNIVLTSEGKTQVLICDINSRAAENACVRGDFLGEPGTLVRLIEKH